MNVQWSEVHVMCSSRKYPYSPQGRDWNFLGVGGAVRPKHLKKRMKLNWNFQRGGVGVLEKVPSVGEVWIVSGITQFTMNANLAPLPFPRFC